MTEYVPITEDLEFPVVPDVKADHAEDLTEEEYKSMVKYIIQCETIFDIIAIREAEMQKKQKK